MLPWITTALIEVSTDIMDGNRADRGQYSYEPLSEKTGLRGFRPGPAQTGFCTIEA